MIREHLFHKSPGADSDFRWRGGEVSRLEAFSDGIFAITITLLIVGNTAINKFYDVWLLVRDLPAFLISFAMIMYAWFEHYMFFRRYGLSDGLTILLNALFLFLIMTLAYPLKLLTTFLWYLIIGEPTQVLFVIPVDASHLFSDFSQRVYMMYFYSASIIGVFGTLLLIHINAYWKRNTLDLDHLERLITTKSITHHGLSAAIAITSIMVLWLTNNPGFSGIVYFLMPLLHFVVGFTFANLISKNKENTQ